VAPLLSSQDLKEPYYQELNRIMADEAGTSTGKVSAAVFRVRKPCSLI
jgi:hypothetical protein